MVQRAFTLLLCITFFLEVSFCFCPSISSGSFGARYLHSAACRGNTLPRMAVGDTVELGDVQKLEQLPVSNVQEALKRALADGCKVCDLISASGVCLN